MPEKPHDHSRLEVRRSDRLFDSAMRLALPIELAPDGETAMILFGQPRANFTAEEWAECEAFKDACHDQIHAIARAMLKRSMRNLKLTKSPLMSYHCGRQMV